MRVCVYVHRYMYMLCIFYITGLYIYIATNFNSVAIFFHEIMSLCTNYVNY